MAEMLIWLGDSGTDYATVIVKVMDAGTVTLTGATNDGPHVANPLVNAGIIKFNIADLLQDQKTAVSISHSLGGSTTITLRTMPAAGEFSVGFGSCVMQNSPQFYAYQLVQDHHVVAWFALGDTPYCDEGMDGHNAALGQYRWKISAAVASPYDDWTLGRSAYDVTYEYLQRTPGWAYLTSKVPTYRLPDDHEYGNDWDWTAENATLFSPGISTQADVDTVGGYANQASWDWNIGNPTNADAESGDWAPSSCVDSSINHPPKYYRKTIGDVEFFHIDCFAHMDADHKTDAHKTVCINADWNLELGYTYSDPSAAALAKTRLGPYQLNWLLVRLQSSTAKFKVILSGKTTHYGNATTDNHGWSGYAQERDYLLAFINRYITGVLWLSGDVHTPSVFNHLYGCACVNSSPLGQNNFYGGGGVLYSPGYTDGQVWRSTGDSGALVSGGITLSKNAYGVLRVTSKFLNPRIYAENGELLWQKYLLEGENYLRSTPYKTWEIAL